jgi:hypothetical protein
MAIRTYQYYATATNNSSIQMLSRGKIVAVLWTGDIRSTAALDGCDAELSLQGSQQTTTNNPIGIISAFTMRLLSATAASIAQASFNGYDPALTQPVNLGDLVYLNTVVAGTIRLRCLVRVLEG